MPIVKPSNNCVDDMILTVFSELKVLGVKVPKYKKFNQKLEASKLEKSETDTKCKIFGVLLSDQEWVSDGEFLLPKFLSLSTAYLQKYFCKEIGLFRKAGNVARQKKLRVILELGGNLEDCEPNDVASLLKQWLRELPEPLIPLSVQDLLIKCLQLEVEENRVTACLLACLLLLPDHLHTLKHLLHFLHNIAVDCTKNKMDVYNLAVIMAPNIFLMQDPSDKVKNNLVKQHTSLMEILIENHDKIGEIPAGVSFDKCYASSEFDSSSEILDSTSNKSKKKCKSGPVQDIFTGIKKLVGQNGTPNTKINTPEANLRIHSRSLSKRKAGLELHSMPAASKKQACTLDALDNPLLVLTPKQKGIPPNNTASGHVRRKSIGALLRRKDRKRFKSCKLPQEVSKLGQKSPKSAEKNILKNQNVELHKDKCVISNETQSIKKSVSDGQLPSKKPELPAQKDMLASSSQGCLPSNAHRTSRRNLRSESLRKLQSGEATILDEGVKRKRTSNHSNESTHIKSLHEAIIDIKENIPLSSTTPQNKCKIEHISTEADRDCETEIRHKERDGVINPRRKSPRLSSNASQNDEVSKNIITIQSHGMKRQEAFIAKNCINDSVEIGGRVGVNCNKKKHFDDFTPKLRDRTSVSSKSTRIRHKKPNTPDQKGMKRRTRHGSLIRGRPNSLNNGLQSLQPAKFYNNPNVILSSPTHDSTSQEKILRYHENRIAESPVLQSLDLSLTTLLQNFTLFSPNNFAQNVSKDDYTSILKQNVISDEVVAENKNNDGKKLIFTPIEVKEKRDISLITKNIDDVTTPLLKKRKRLSGKSDSKVSPIKRCSNPKQGNSLGQGIQQKKDETKREIPQCMVTFSCSSSFNLENLKSPLTSNEHNLDVSYGNLKMDDSCFKTPISKAVSPESEVWMSGSSFLGILSPPQDEVFNKRESIAMILKNNTGHVQAKVDLYDKGKHSSSKNKDRENTNLLQTPQTCRSASKNKIYSSRKPGSEARGSSAKNRIKFQKSPLPPPPKFTLADQNTPSPKTLQALKEVTNTTPRIDEFKASPKITKIANSPAQQAKSQLRKEDLKLVPKLKKLKRNSFSGTPYKLSKRVSRSESSPACRRRVIVVNQ